MSPDEQYALSRKYSNEAIILLPMPSNNYAVFARNFKFLGFAGSLDAVKELRDSYEIPPPPIPIRSAEPDIDISSLDIGDIEL